MHDRFASRATFIATIALRAAFNRHGKCKEQCDWKLYSILVHSNMFFPIFRGSEMKAANQMEMHRWLRKSVMRAIARLRHGLYSELLFFNLLFAMW